MNILRSTKLVLVRGVANLVEIFEYEPLKKTSSAKRLSKEEIEDAANHCHGVTDLEYALEDEVWHKSVQTLQASEAL